MFFFLIAIAVYRRMSAAHTAIPGRISKHVQQHLSPHWPIEEKSGLFMEHAFNITRLHQALYMWWNEGLHCVS
jgi:hypothetical protein